MSLSKRIRAISPSPTLAIDAKSKQMVADGIDVVNFSVGEPDFDTPDHIKEAAIKAIHDGFTKYTAAAGIAELKKVICKKFVDDNGLEYSPDQIVVSVGAKHSLFNAYQALLDEGDEVILQAPYWVTYPEVIKLAGGVPVVVDTDETTGFKMTPAQIREKLTPRTKVINLNSPSNPTGAVYNRKELEAIAEIVLENNLYVVSDEIYEELVYGGVEFVSFAALGEQVKNRTIVINGVSKSYAMTGWRIGYAASPLDLAKGMAKLQGHVTSNPTSIAQKAAVAAIGGPKKPVRDMVKEFDKRRKHMAERVNRIPGFNCGLPDGAFYLFPNVEYYFGTEIAGRKIETSDDLAEVILEQAKVAVVPGSGFGSPKNIRFSYATSMERIDEGLDRIEALLK
ncbi:MAG: pyridoxal phosphate-dependent aminotransferase [Bacillota bacterium]